MSAEHITMDRPVEQNTDELTLQAEQFVRRNIIKASEGRECVDGRYDQHGVEGGNIARPGGDFGYVMGLLALVNEGHIELSPEEAVDAVFDAVTVDNGKFFAHSDQDARDNGKLTGCGHIMKSTMTEHATKYGVHPDHVVTALNYMRDKSTHQEVDEPELSGKHSEKGVLIVESSTSTLDHHDENDMYFVYDKTRDQEFVEKLIEKMNIDGLRKEDFVRVLDQQTNATVGILAAGLPIFSVDLKEAENPQVSFVQFVPKAA